MKKTKTEKEQQDTKTLLDEVKGIKKQFLIDQSLKNISKNELDIIREINSYETHTKLKPNSIKNWLSLISFKIKIGASFSDIHRIYSNAISSNLTNELIWSKFLNFYKENIENIEKSKFISTANLLWFHLKDSYRHWQLIFQINNIKNFIDKETVLINYLNKTMSYSIYKAYLEPLEETNKLKILEIYYNKFNKQIETLEINDLDDLHRYYSFKEIDTFESFFGDLIKNNFISNISKNNAIDSVSSLFIDKLTFFSNISLFIKFIRCIQKYKGKLYIIKQIITILKIDPKQQQTIIIESDDWIIECFKEKKTFIVSLTEKDLYTILNFLKELLYKSEGNEKEVKNMDLYYLIRCLILVLKTKIYDKDKEKIKFIKKNYLTFKMTKLNDIKDKEIIKIISDLSINFENSI